MFFVYTRNVSIRKETHPVTNIYVTCYDWWFLNRTYVSWLRACSRARSWKAFAWLQQLRTVDRKFMGSYMERIDRYRLRNCRSLLSSNNHLRSFNSMATLQLHLIRVDGRGFLFHDVQPWRQANESRLRHEEVAACCRVVEDRVKLQAFVYSNYDSEMSKQAIEMLMERLDVGQWSENVGSALLLVAICRLWLIWPWCLLLYCRLARTFNPFLYTNACNAG